MHSVYILLLQHRIIQLLVEQPPQIPLSIFQRDDGGFWGMNADGTPNNEIYYVGIIYILQQYNTIKYGENLYKSWFTSSGSSKISALPPKRLLLQT